MIVKEVSTNLTDEPRVLEVDMNYMRSLSDDFVCTSYISDGIYDLVGGYYTVRGKIFYDEEHFDYYVIRAYTRKQARKFRLDILTGEIFNQQ